MNKFPENDRKYIKPYTNGRCPCCGRTGKRYKVSYGSRKFTRCFMCTNNINRGFDCHSYKKLVKNVKDEICTWCKKKITGGQCYSKKVMDEIRWSEFYDAYICKSCGSKHNLIPYKKK